MGQKCEGNRGLWVLNEIIKKIYPKNLKKMWEPFGSYLLNNTANPAQFECKWCAQVKGSQVIFFYYLFRFSRNLAETEPRLGFLGSKITKSIFFNFLLTGRKNHCL